MGPPETAPRPPKKRVESARSEAPDAKPGESGQECLPGFPRESRGDEPLGSVVEAAASTTTNARIRLHADGRRHEGGLLTGVAEGVIQGLRHPGAKPVELGGARRDVGKRNIHGPCSGRHFSIGPTRSDANRYLHRFRLEHFRLLQASFRPKSLRMSLRRHPIQRGRRPVNRLGREGRPAAGHQAELGASA